MTVTMQAPFARRPGAVGPPSSAAASRSGRLRW